MDQSEIQRELELAQAELHRLEREMDTLRRRAVRTLVRVRECERALACRPLSEAAS